MIIRASAILSAAVVLLLATIAVTSITTYVNVFAFERSQGSPQTSECGNDSVSINIGCQSTDSQIQGDENAVALKAQQTFPVAVQEEPVTPPEETCGDGIDNDGDGAADEDCLPSIGKATLIVEKRVDNSGCEVNCHSADDFTILVNGDEATPSTFPGSEAGTTITLNEGVYTVDEIHPPDSRYTGDATDPDCRSTISEGETKVCTIMNTFIPISPVNIVFASWVESDNKILSKRSIDAGSSFGNNIDLSANADCCSMPAAASFQNNVYVIWSSYDDLTSQDDILFRKSTDGGASFGSTINLSNTPNRSFQAAIAVSGNEVYVVWSDGTLDNHDILLRKSNNGGASFGDIMNLSEDLPGYSSQPSVAVNGKDVYLVWRESTATYDEIFYRKSTDGGTTFSESINLSNSVGNSAVPVVAASGNNVYLVWSDASNGDSETLLRRSTDNGNTFEITVNLSNSNFINSGTASIVASGNNVYIAWGEFGPLNIEVLFRKSTDNGATFESAVNLSSNNGESWYPKLAILDDEIYVVWNDDSLGNFEIFYRRSMDNGATFGSTVNLSDTDGKSWTPTITATAVPEN